jgi:hypothetical protein
MQVTRTRGVLLATALALSCSASAPTEEVLRQIALDTTDEIITKSGIALDTEITTDGRGSIRIEASGPTTVRIAEVEDLTIEEARLIYRARLRTADLQGAAFLEMWCVFPGRGEFFSRALQSPLTGTNDWVTQETPFLLQKGQTPSRVKLNLVVQDAGTVWIDEITVVRAPL